MTCPCGETSDHTLARRMTADGTQVLLWTDGAVTGALGFKLPGVTMVRPKTASAVTVARAAGWLLLGDVELYDLDEVPALYAACRKVAGRGGCPGDVRALLGRSAVPAMHWTVRATNRDGVPTWRVCRLPRLRWPGLMVWDHCTGGRGGRYELMTVDRHDVCMPTGFRFATLATLWDHLRTV